LHSQISQNCCKTMHNQCIVTLFRLNLASRCYWLLWWFCKMAETWCCAECDENSSEKIAHLITYTMT